MTADPVLRNLLFLDAGCVLLNVAMSAALYARERNPVYRLLLLAWTANVVSFVVQGVLSTGDLAIVVGFASTFPANLVFAQLLGMTAGIVPPWRLHLSLLGAGLVLSAGILARQHARERRVDVLMLSDFGHRVHLMWNPFRHEPDAPLGAGATDDDLLACLAEAKSGDRAKMFRFVAALCGDDLAGDQFGAWVEGRGEHPTASLPQSGATAMASGAIGGKEIAMRVLGYPLPSGNRIVYDLLHRRVL